MVNDVIAKTDGLKYSKTDIISVVKSLDSMRCSNADKG